MSTYYELRCDPCDEQGGFFSRQAWGWGNADVIGNTKFLMAHATCGSLRVLSEHDEGWAEEGPSEKWRDNWRNGEARNMWPHDDWADYAKSENLWETWMRLREEEEES